MKFPRKFNGIKIAAAYIDLVLLASMLQVASISDNIISTIVEKPQLSTKTHMTDFNPNNTLKTLIDSKLVFTLT